MSSKQANPKIQTLGAAFGALFAAVGAASCCVLPLALFLAGVSGSWIGSLTVLAPYQFFFVAGSLGLIGYGFWRMRRSVNCQVDGICVRPVPRRIASGMLAIAFFLVVASMIVPRLYLYLST